MRKLYALGAIISFKIYNFCQIRRMRYIKLYLPFAGNLAYRTNSSIKKLETIEKELKKPCSILDIGCNNGYFIAELAKRGHFCMGIDQFKQLEGGRFLVNYYKIKSVGLIDLLISPDNVDILPDVDVTLFMSTFQKMVFGYGFQKSLDILHILWNKTKTMMFFEMPDSLQSVEPFKSCLPDMGRTKQECDDYINSMLQGLKPKEIKKLGTFDMDYRNETRTLWCVYR